MKERLVKLPPPPPPPPPPVERAPLLPLLTGLMLGGAVRLAKLSASSEPGGAWRDRLRSRMCLVGLKRAAIVVLAWSTSWASLPSRSCCSSVVSPSSPAQCGEWACAASERGKEGGSEGEG